MAREAKIGIALIGILLVVFGALLVKRMARPSKVQVGDLAGSQQPSFDPAKRRLQQPAAPTLVTAKSENSKPPESRYGTRSEVEQSAPSHAGAPTPPRPDATAPNLLTTPLEVPGVGDRYAQSKPQSQSATAKPYRSGYGPTEGADRRAATPPTKGSSTDSLYAEGQDTNPFRRVTPEQLRGQPTDANAAGQSYREAGNSAALRTGVAPARPVSTSSPAASYPPAPQQQAAYDRAPYNAQPGAPAQPGMSLGDDAPGIQLDGDQYSVGPNDSYWTICEKAYGNGAFFKALYHFNRKRRSDADELTVGQVISVPEESVLRRKYPDMCPRPQVHTPSAHQRLASAGTRLRGSGRTYTVVEGDTLFDIARYELGKAARWGEIYDLNRDVLGDDFDYLRPGLELILPDDGRRRENVTRQPEAPYSR